MIRNLILLMLLLLTVAGGRAQTALTLKMTDGSQNVVYLKGPDTAPAMVPYITFEGDDMVIHGDQELRVAMKDVQHYIYSNKISGVDAIGNDVPTVEFKSNEIVVSNRLEGSETLIYSANGSLVRSVLQKGEATQISLDGLAEGVYLIKVGSVTYKFLKR